MSTIQPHGGTLISRLAADAQALQNEAKSLVTIQVPKREQCDIEMIGNGAVGVRENQIFVEAMTDTDSDLRKLRSAVQATL